MIMDNKTIRLCGDNMTLYGFVCFHDLHGKANPGTDDDEAAITVREAGGRERYIRIDRGHMPRIPLSWERKNKLTAHKAFDIVEKKDALATVFLLSARAGWNQTEFFLKRLIDMPGNTLFIARYKIEEQEAFLGSGDLFALDDTLFWIGMVLVHPEVQRQGIAARLLLKCLHRAYRHNRYAVVGLDATPQGKPLYKKLGFRESFDIWLCSLNTKKPPLDLKGDLTIDPLTEPSRVIAYWNRKFRTGKKGQAAFLLGMENGGCFVALKQGRVAGIILSRPGRLRPHVGPLMADTALIAAALLQHTLDHWRKRAEEEVFLMVPESHFEEVRGCKCREWQFRLPFTVQCIRSLTRMYHIPSPQENNTVADEQHIRGINDFLEQERREVLPDLYAIGGAEIG